MEYNFLLKTENPEIFSINKISGEIYLIKQLNETKNCLKNSKNILDLKIFRYFPENLLNLIPFLDLKLIINKQKLNKINKFIKVNSNYEIDIKTIKDGYIIGRLPIENQNYLKSTKIFIQNQKFFKINQKSGEILFKNIHQILNQSIFEFWVILQSNQTYSR